MRDLVILGAGVHAGETAEIAERINQVKPTWNLLGFISPKPEQAGGDLNGYPILGGPDKVAELANACCVPEYSGRGIAVPRERLVTLIDPSCFVSRTAQIGVGCVIYPHCYIGLNARIGDLVFCLSGCSINHDDVLEDLVVLASGVRLAGYVHVEPRCYLGQSCTVRQNIRIGSDSLIGMGAVVVKNVEPYSVMVGNPARKLRDVRDKK